MHQFYRFILFSGESNFLIILKITNIQYNNFIMLNYHITNYEDIRISFENLSDIRNFNISFYRVLSDVSII